MIDNDYASWSCIVETWSLLFPRRHNCLKCYRSIFGVLARGPNSRDSFSGEVIQPTILVLHSGHSARRGREVCILCARVWEVVKGRKVRPLCSNKATDALEIASCCYASSFLLHTCAHRCTRIALSSPFVDCCTVSITESGMLKAVIYS